MSLENHYIGFDRDGTLELPGIEMPPSLKGQFESLKAQGATLFIASGKSYSQLQEICQRIGLMPWLLCAENGAQIVIPERSIDKLEGANHADLLKFTKAVEKIMLPPFEAEEKRLIWSKKFGQNAQKAGELLKQFINANQLELEVFTYLVGGGSVEVVPKGIDKVRLLEYIPDSAVVHYIGDSDNDLQLMQHPRVIPHTVSNASNNIKECVKEKGGIISEQPAGIGVTAILDKLLHK